MMNKRTIRHYLMIAIIGMFCWLTTSVVMAQTATDLNCSLCVGPGEVANGAIRWSSLDAAAQGFLINQANDVNAAVALVATLEATVATLQASLTAAEATITSLQASSVPNLGTYLRIGSHNGKPAALFEAVNVLVVDGSGNTEGTTNGLGNLIVGYDEVGGGVNDKTGSHNMVVGQWHTYSSHGGLVAGLHNFVTGVAASVSGGYGNTASGDQSSVSGGGSHTASGLRSSVSGGWNRAAPNENDWAAGGEFEDF